MARQEHHRAARQLRDTGALLRLYVAGTSPNSALALANLQALLAGPLAGAFELEVIDVFEAPEQALRDRVLVTPTLLKLSPLPGCRILGTLSDTALVLRSLGHEAERITSKGAS